MSDLKPCAHCGGKAELEDHRLVWMVCCTKCNAMFRGDSAEEPESDEDANGTDWDHYEKTAIDGWNQRDTSAIEAAVLRRVADELFDEADRIEKGARDV